MTTWNDCEKDLAIATAPERRVLRLREPCTSRTNLLLRRCRRVRLQAYSNRGASMSGKRGLNEALRQSRQQQRAESN